GPPTGHKAGPGQLAARQSQRLAGQAERVDQDGEAGVVVAVGFEALPEARRVREGQGVVVHESIVAQETPTGPARRPAVTSPRPHPLGDVSRPELLQGRRQAVHNSYGGGRVVEVGRANLHRARTSY